MTRQRREMLAELGAHDSFRSAQQVHDDLGGKGIKIGLATVYRNLQELAEGGQVDSLRAEDGETLYRLCEVDSHHHHLICRSCGRVEEIATTTLEAWLRDVTAKYGFTQERHSIEIFGLCGNCQRDEALRSQSRAQ